MFFKKKKEVLADSRLSHIAFIMDGNGRWAQNRGLPRKAGHKYGTASLEKVLKLCKDKGIKTVTLYAFSTENWTRPKDEIDSIIELLHQYIKKASDDRNARYIFLGDKSVLTEDLRNEMLELEKMSASNEFTVNIAFNYGGRAEIVNAVNSLLKEGKTVITEDDISGALYTKLSKDPDLIVRTANEYRLSNFLLWQCAYSEFYFTPVLWPDFGEKELDAAILSFYKRKRRFGGLNKDEE